jgi:glucokinase
LSTSFVCGFDVGGTKLLALAFDPEDPGRWRLERRIPTPAGAEAIVDAIARCTRDLADEVERHHGATLLHAVGLGIAGLVDRAGVLRMGPNLPGIVDAPIAEMLAAALDVPVDVENDATAATWAEHRVGAGIGVDELMVVTLGTGIGGGIVTGGKLALGVHGFAGEIGHMVVDRDGRPCPCGKRGCWERYASGSGLGRLARDAAEAGRLQRVVAEVGDADLVRGEHVTRAAKSGDPEAAAVYREFASWVGLGLANLTNLLDPELFVIAGGLVAAGETLLGPVERAYEDALYAPDRRPPARVVPALLGEEAGAIGAGLLAAERL